MNPERKFPSLFEPVHGSAPDIYGKNIANPVGQIWAGAMMLDFLTRGSGAGRDAHDAILRAIEQACCATGRARPTSAARPHRPRRWVRRSRSGSPTALNGAPAVLGGRPCPPRTRSARRCAPRPRARGEWVMALATSHVPHAFRSSFLRLNSVTAALLALVQRAATPT